jgi:hypothetical protein
MDPHPLTVENGPRFPIPPLVELNDALTKFASAGCISVTCYGMPRSGKSTALAVLIDMLEASGAAVVYSTVMKSSTGGFSTLMEALQLSRGGKVTFPSLKPENAFIRKAVADRDERGTGRIWILIDEAQYLSYAQFIGLKGTLTEMAKLKLAPFIVLFGQPEILSLPERFKAVGDASLVHRFMNHKYRMRGLMRNEYGGMLGHYDTTRCSETGPTYTEYFAPNFWGRGGRMTQLEPHLIAGFQGVATRAQQNPDDIPVAYFMEAATSVLQELDEADPDEKAFTDLVQQAVLATGLTETYEFLGNLEARSRERKAPGKLFRGYA